MHLQQAKPLRIVLQPSRWVAVVAALAYLMLPAVFAGHASFSHAEPQVADCAVEAGAPGSHEPADEEAHCDLCRLLGTLMHSGLAPGAQPLPSGQGGAVAAELRFEQVLAARELPPALCPRGPPAA